MIGCSSMSKGNKNSECSSIALGHLHTRKGSRKTNHWERLRILFDSGCLHTIVNDESTTGLLKMPNKNQQWKTKGGTFNTKSTCKIVFTLPMFHKHRDTSWKAHVDESPRSHSRCDLTTDRDLTSEMGMDLCFSTCSMRWDNAEVRMQDPDWLSKDNLDKFESELFMTHDPDSTDAERIQSIMDLKHSKADLKSTVQETQHLDKPQQDKLLKVLQKFEPLFDGTLGSWKTSPVELELKDPNCKPHHAKPCPVPQSQERKLKEETERLVNFGVLKKVNESEWASPAFTISKPDGTLRSLTDSRELNERIKRFPHPLPKILLQKLEGFQWATSLDLNMGHHHPVLSPTSRRLCTVVFPWGKHEHCRLPMGLCNSPDIFQEKMGELIGNLEFA